MSVSEFRVQLSGLTIFRRKPLKSFDSPKYYTTEKVFLKPLIMYFIVFYRILDLGKTCCRNSRRQLPRYLGALENVYFCFLDIKMTPLLRERLKMLRYHLTVFSRTLFKTFRVADFWGEKTCSLNHVTPDAVFRKIQRKKFSRVY